MKRILFPRSFLIGLFCLLSIFLLLIFAESAVSAARHAAETWLKVILPSLLPFSILADLLLQSGTAQLLTRKIGRPISGFFGFSHSFFYVFLMSLLSGYPVGARLTTALYEENQLSREEASLMLNACSTCGPSFLLAGVAVGMLREPRLGLLLLPAHVLAAAVTAAANGRIPHMTLHTEQFLSTRKSAGMMFLSSVTQSVSGMLIVLGAMVLFSGLSAVFGELLNVLNPSPILSAMLTGFLEFSAGCEKAASLSSPLSLLLISFFCGFGSLSVYLQTRAVAAKSGIPDQHLFLSKLMQGSLSAFFAELLILPSAGLSPVAFLPPALSLCFLILFRRKNIKKNRPAKRSVPI